MNTDASTLVKATHEHVANNDQRIATTNSQRFVLAFEPVRLIRQLHKSDLLGL